MERFEHCVGGTLKCHEYATENEGNKASASKNDCRNSDCAIFRRRWIRRSKNEGRRDEKSLSSSKSLSEQVSSTNEKEIPSEC